MAERAHTLECAERFNAAVRARGLWRQLWPEACFDCAGLGVHVTKDVGTLGQVMQECSTCLMANVCPRCGETDSLNTSERHPRCSHCGWTLEAGGEPVLPGCSCAEVARG